MEQPRGQIYRIAWFFYLLMAVIGVSWMALRTGTMGPEPFFDPEGWWIDILVGLGGGGALLLLWEGMRSVLPTATRLEDHLRPLVDDLDSYEIFALALLSGLAEEIFFRGAVQGAFGYWVATLLFAVLHTGRGRDYQVWMLFAALAGLLLGGLMLWRGNLLAPILAHVLVNAVNLRKLAAGR